MGRTSPTPSASSASQGASGASPLDALRALVRLRRLEKDAKERGGRLSDEELGEAMGAEDTARLACVKGTGMALLHLPVKTAMDLAWFAVTPLVTAYLVLHGSVLHAFAAYLALRLAAWAYDTALLGHAERAGHVPFNSSWVSTLLGTFPYRNSRVVGPGLSAAMDIAMLLPFTGVLGLSSLGMAGAAVEIGAVVASVFTVVNRHLLNTVIVLEMHGGADRLVGRAAGRTVDLFRSAATEMARIVLQVPAAARRTAHRARARTVTGLAGVAGVAGAAGTPHQTASGTPPERGRPPPGAGGPPWTARPGRRARTPRPAVSA